MLKPVNGHLIVEPIVHETFIASQKDTYEEIGVVVAVPDIITHAYDEEKPRVGDRVYFDSYLVAKFPKEKDGEYYWLVKWEDVRAVEYVEQK